MNFMVHSKIDLNSNTWIFTTPTPLPKWLVTELKQFDAEYCEDELEYDIHISVREDWVILHGWKEIYRPNNRLFKTMQMQMS